MQSSNLIVANSLNHKYHISGEQAVTDASFRIERGEVVCILGPSGAGKSTLLRLLAGLEKKYHGTLDMDDALKAPGEVVYVSQEYTLWPHVTVLENLLIAPREVLKTSEEALRSEAVGLLERFGLAEYADSYPHQLSGGQKQRVALLRALMMHPSVLLLDEVTSALDPELTKSVLDTIRTLAKDGYTMVVVTHHLQLALSIADRILFMEKGRIVQDAPAHEFFHQQEDARILSFIQSASHKDHTVEIFEGKEQFQAYHLGLLKRLPEASTIYVAGAVGDRWYEPMGEFASIYDALREKKGIVWKMAMYDVGEKDKELLREHPELNRFRLMPRTIKNPANYNVMDDTVIIQIFGEKPTIMEIRDPAVAETYREFFEEMWRVSRPITLDGSGAE